MCQPVGRREHPPFVVLVQAQAVVGSGPDPVAVYANTIDAVIGQALRGGEVLPAEPGQLPCAEQADGYKESRNSHKVFRYSIKSLSSSFAKSFVTPCVSLGLNTVQISSKLRAEPSCRYGALYATFVKCGVSINGDRSVVLPVPTSASFWLV